MREVDNIRYISGRELWSVEWKNLTQVGPEKINVLLLVLHLDVMIIRDMLVY